MVQHVFSPKLVRVLPKLPDGAVKLKADRPQTSDAFRIDVIVDEAKLTKTITFLDLLRTFASV